MSNKEALDIFIRKHVTTEMVDYLVQTTQSIIKVKSPEDDELQYPSPPASPGSSDKKTISLKSFVINLIRYSNVQVPTLMSTLVYLNRLKKILPSDQIYGIATTHHRIFVGCLILTAKYVNDSSPLNKHWARYSSGLLSIKELNVIEVEVLSYLDWDLSITNEDLFESLNTFLAPIKNKLKSKEEEEEDNLRSFKPSFKTIKQSASINSIKKLLCPPSASSLTFSENSISPICSLNNNQNNTSNSSLSSPNKPNVIKTSQYSIPSLTNSASTYQSNSNSSSTYSLNNSSTSSLTKKMIEEDFSFVEPPNKNYSPVYSNIKPHSLFSSPKSLLAKMTSSKNSPKTESPKLYKIASNSSLKSNNSLMSPLVNFKAKIKKSNLGKVNLNQQTFPKPPTVKKAKNSVSSNTLKHFNSSIRA